MSDEDMRPNPRYEALQELLDLAQSKEESIAEALDDALSIMEEGDAWSGPTTATTFTEDLGYRRDDLPGLAQRLVEEIRDKLDSTPPEIARHMGGEDIPV